MLHLTEHWNRSAEPPETLLLFCRSSEVFCCKLAAGERKKPVVLEAKAAELSAEVEALKQRGLRLHAVPSAKNA